LNKWETKTDLNFNRHGTQAIVSGEGIFITGGSPERGGGRQHNMEVYGMDKPVGEKIKASRLSADVMLEFTGKETKELVITSSGGNAGNYITDIAILGKGAKKFSIETNLKDRLIKSNTSQKIVMASKVKKCKKPAKLVVTYDDGKKIEVRLSVIELR